MVTEDQAHRWAWRYGGTKPAARALRVPRAKLRRWLDPGRWRKYDRERKLARWTNDPEYRAQLLARKHDRYWSDPEYRALCLARKREWERMRYANDPDFRLRKAQYGTLRTARNRIAELENRAKELYS